MALSGFANDSTEVCHRLSVIEKQIPLPYHWSLQNRLQTYASKPLPVEFAAYRETISTEIGRLDLPEELLYLPLALSGMKPDYNFNERAGIWAMPVLVALYYGLTIDETHDERFSVEASTQAALSYLYDLHQNFTDWWLCLLAYTNSPSAVKGVQTRHPENALGPWDFVDHQWLPNTEIVGNFIASYDVYCAEKSVMALTSEEFAYCEFDQPVAVSKLSALTGVPEQTLKQLNPVFSTDVFVPFKDYRLKLPKDVQQQFETGKEQLYKESSQPQKKKEVAKPAPDNQAKDYITYTVKPGDTLSGIASKFHVTVNDIKQWNNLKGDFIRDQQKLKIYQ